MKQTKVRRRTEILKLRGEKNEIETKRSNRKDQ